MIAGTRRARRAVVFVVFALLAPAAAPAGGSEVCPDPPDPRTCDRYETWDDLKGWRPVAPGSWVIDYSVNPIQPWMPEETAVAGIRAAFQTWEDWIPTLRFRYLGTTTEPPVPRDGRNVVGFGLTVWPTASAQANVAPEDWPTQGIGIFNESTFSPWYIGEVDITVNVVFPKRWEPCEQADDSCVPTYYRGPWADPPDPVPYGDIQSLVTHEVGHLLGLDHVSGPDATYLTMSPTGPPEDGRPMSTLGLGDVLGAKHLYPWTCPPDGEPIPARYSRVCPTIQIFSP